MFNKIFGRKNVPTNDGDSTRSKIDKQNWVKVFELELSNMEGSPTYSLTHQLSIGSEIGNIVVSDPSISPRHCTFVLQQEVVSVIDHGSLSGTSVNGKKIPSGKYIILEESDVITLGDLEVKIVTRLEAAPVENIDEPVIEDEDEDEDTIAEVDDEDEELEDEEAPPSLPKSYAANSLVRVIAVIGDLLLAYSIYILLHPFDEFRSFVEFIPSLVDWKVLGEVIGKEYAFVSAILEDLISFFSTTFHILPILVLFALVRLVSTLLFGASISQSILSIQGIGNKIWKRVGGFLRELVGLVTGPLLIFDIPAVISRRTVKEFLTFTHLVLKSKLIAIIATLLYIPLLVLLALVSPLFQGLDAPQSINVVDRIDQRVRVAPKPDEPLPELMSDSGEHLGMGIKYNPREVALIPFIKFVGAKNKLSYKTEMGFFHKETKRLVELEVYKTFDLQQLLGIALKGNYFLFEKFPEIYNFVFTPETTSVAFKALNTPAAQKKFASEFIELVNLAFELNLENAPEVMQTQTPLLKGLMDFKSSFLALLEFKNIDQVGFVRMGNRIFMRVNYLQGRPFDLIIPLERGQGKIYKVTFDKKEELNDLSSRFYKYTLHETNWSSPDKVEGRTDILSPLQVIDLFVSEKGFTPESAQALYGYYFEVSTYILQDASEEEYNLWKRSVNSIFQVIETLSKNSTDPVMEKLFQNFRDLKDAVDNRNVEYFGISSTETI